MNTRITSAEVLEWTSLGEHQYQVEIAFDVPEEIYGATVSRLNFTVAYEPPTGLVQVCYAGSEHGRIAPSMPDLAECIVAAENAVKREVGILA